MTKNLVTKTLVTKNLTSGNAADIILRLVQEFSFAGWQSDTGVLHGTSSKTEIIQGSSRSPQSA
jgi:hypothetical protein